jgi:hypothetical protein
MKFKFFGFIETFNFDIMFDLFF